MSDEIRISSDAGLTLYFHIRNAAGQVWYVSGQVFETYGTSSRDSDAYDVALVDKLVGFYVGDFDTNLSAAGTYFIVVLQQLGANPDDSDVVLASGKFFWNGTAEVDFPNALVASGDLSNYNDLSDSQQAIRDRGDIAWLTGAGAGATASYTTTDWTRTIGDDDGGTGSDTVSVNGTTFDTGEVNSGTFIEVDGTFTISAGEFAQRLDLWGFYNGGAGHGMQALALDVATSVYEPLAGSIGLGTEVELHSFDLAPGHTNTSTNEVKIKFLHQGGNGVPSHVFSIDKAQVNTTSPADSEETINAIITALKVSTGWTAGNTLTFAEVTKITVAGVAGGTEDSATPGTYSKLDVDDQSTEIFTITPSTTTPFVTVVIT